VKVAVVGAGAIGAYVGAALARGGSTVTLIARGVRVHSERGDFAAHPVAVGRIAEAGPVDVVILALKAHQLDDVLDELPALFHPGTMVVGMQNGLPWWYFARHGGPYDGMVLDSVDPGGRISAAIDPQRVIGCVVYAAAEIEAPGIIRHVEGTRFTLGEPDRSLTERSRELAAAFIAGGLKAPVEREIRSEIWLKLLGNASFNPLSALTRATLVELADDPFVEPLVREMMLECTAVANALGVEFEITIERRIDGARRVGAHKTSMLQDLEARKPFETEALVGCVVELGAKLGIAVPATRHVYALVKLLEGSIRAGR
jgi:2-dehydropantoate 2-reductase